MPELVPPTRLPPPELRLGEGVDRILFLNLVRRAERLEGLPEGILRARTALGEPFLTEAERILGLGGERDRLTAALNRRIFLSPGDLEAPPARIHRILADLPPETWEAAAREALASALEDRAPEDPLKALEALGHPDPAEGVRLLAAGGELRDRFLDLLAAVGVHHRVLWGEHRERLEESLHVLRDLIEDGGALGTILLRITGRRLPAAVLEKIAAAARLVFLPSPLLGPYVAVMELNWGNAVLYNGLQAGLVAADLSRLFPLLKALADETRLEIVRRLMEEGESYVQALSRQLGLAQPTVLRHVQLMLRAGILEEGREAGRIRYLRLSRAGLRTLIENLERIEARAGRRDRREERD